MSPKILLAVAGVAGATQASAIQPLEEFLRGARASGPDVAEARAARRQAHADADAALGRALPGLSIQGTYTRNEAGTTIDLPGAGGAPTPVTIVPRDQLDARAALDVPLVDLSKFAGIGAARTGARASDAQAASTDLAVQSSVARSYHQLVADLALVEAARRARDVAAESLRIAEERLRAGSATSLDVDRARAEVERDVQQVATAELQVSLVARALASLTGVDPELGGAVVLADDLHEEPPLERFQVPDESIPALAASIGERASADQQARAQRLSLVPSLGATLSEQATSVEGLAGRNHAWQAVLGLRWSFDLTTLATIGSRDAAADAARAREQRTRLAARDGIHAAWQTVRTDIARSPAARAQAEVAGRAAALALERYRAGAAAQLDLLVAQRDAYAAEAARIQADADLVDARGQLRLAAGESLLAGPTGVAR